jgi:superoxide dismutase, Cu-Zn family
MHLRTFAAAAAALLVACGGQDSAPGADTSEAGNADSAQNARGGGGGNRSGDTTAVVRDASGRDLGTLIFSDSAGGISITGTLRGLTPGEHGIHIHTVGQCDGPAFTSAGGHWNPDSARHGMQSAEGAHRGDLQNITVGADSAATVQLSTSGGTLRGLSLLLDADGAAIVVHAKADDYRTDPSGNSGDRIACGVIGGS